MDYQAKEIVIVVVLLGMAALMGVVIGLFQQGATGAAIFDGGACTVNADCDDGVQCTIDSCKNAGEENSFCSNSPVDYCLSDDGCCPRGCSTNNDNDC